MIIDGKAVSAQVREELKQRTENFLSRTGRRPGLAVVLIGEDPASEVYVRNKFRGCEEVGIRSFDYRLPQDTEEEEAEALLLSLSAREEVDGILLQLPLPKGLNEQKLLSLIPPEKDVDGFSPSNLGNLAMGREAIVACTPLGVMELLKRYHIPLAGKHAVVVGRSNTVGKPMAMLLTNANATVTLCHSRTENLKEECRRADLLVVAVGKPKFITEDMVKEGAVVIDVGINRDEAGKLCGDVAPSVAQKASFITPVPGGVGPMTVAMLLHNTCLAAEASAMCREGGQRG